MNDNLTLNLYFLGQVLKIYNPIKLNEENTCIIGINGDTNLIIELSYDEETEEFTITIPLFIDLGNEQEDHLKLFKSMVLGMQLYEGTEGILVSEPYAERLVLSKQVSINDTHPAHLAACVPNLLEEAKHWRRLLGSILKSDEEKAATVEEIDIPNSYLF